MEREREVVPKSISLFTKNVFMLLKTDFCKNMHIEQKQFSQFLTEWRFKSLLI